LKVSGPLALLKKNRPLWLKLRYAYREARHNRDSRRRYRGDMPLLTPVQERVVGELRSTGLAMLPCSELVPTGVWEELSETMEGFVRSEQVERGAQSYLADPGRSGSGKEYLIRAHPKFCTLPGDSPWLRFGVCPAVLDIVNTYLGLCAKLNYVDLWYTVPLPREREAVASQRWHRDPEDRRVVKVFLYFSDVDARAGPFQYARGTAAGGPYARLWPNRTPMDASYPPEEEVSRAIPPSERVTCTGPRGTLIFCDTHGLHRGGFATERPRVLAVWSYLSPASLFERRFFVDWSGCEPPGDPAARFALI
jgi:hypothetical protein